jgi:CubicO group peptidase (beta-lactamase class C family)
MKKAFLKLLLPVLGIMIAVTSCSGASDGSSTKEQDINSYSVAYFENDTVTYENHGKRIDENSVFELGSNGKTVCAYVALRMADEGKINLDDRITQYLDKDLITNDERINDITVRQLLCHTAGFSPSYELGVDKKIYSDPGEKFRYSGVGYIYLQNVIENASGMSMEKAAEHYVFEPLGMNSSTFEYTPTVTPYISLSSAVLYAFAVFIISFAVVFVVLAIIGKITKFRAFSLKTGLVISYIAAGVLNTAALLFILSKVTVVFAVFYVITGILLFLARKTKKIFYALIPALTAVILVVGFTVPCSIPVTNDLIHKEANCAYSLRSTGSDMAVFCRELMKQYGNGDKMFSEAVVIDENNSWGLGIAIESETNGKTYWHSGINPGFQSLYVLSPDQDKFIVVVTNSDSGLESAKEKANEFLGTDGSWEIAR